MEALSRSDHQRLFGTSVEAIEASADLCLLTFCIDERGRKLRLTHVWVQLAARIGELGGPRRSHFVDPCEGDLIEIGSAVPILERASRRHLGDMFPLSRQKRIGSFHAQGAPMDADTQKWNLSCRR